MKTTRHAAEGNPAVTCELTVAVKAAGKFYCAHCRDMTEYRSCCESRVMDQFRTYIRLHSACSILSMHQP